MFQLPLTANRFIKRPEAISSLLLFGALLLLTAGGCTRQMLKFDEEAHRQEVEQWQKTRLANLTKEDGWLTLIGLHWLKEGENTFGSDPSNSVVISKMPKFGGSIWLENDIARIEIAPGVEITNDGKPVASGFDLKSDADGQPTVLNFDSLTFFVIKRSDQYALRVRDKESQVRTSFKGLEYFPIDPKFRIEARFENYNPPKKIPIGNVTGTVSEETSPGAIVFEIDGTTYTLDPILEQGTEDLFIIFSDQTSGKETYGAGRYLYTKQPDENGRLIIDFNKAYSPPCAFTEFATCPLPPPQNRIPIRIEAGEKYSAH